MVVPRRQVRASFDASSIVVYQAYGDQIAEPALAAQRFVPPFKRSRMTWIKPSFLWMAYRSGWAGKSGQERVLAIRVRRDGFDWALQHAALSHYDRATDVSQAEWRRRLSAAPVRVQWDPERDLHLSACAHRAIQIGLSGEAVDRYVDQWIVSLEDVTPLMHEVRALVAAGELDRARAALPAEAPYPLGPDQLVAAAADE